ncbi:MAG: virulence RhuM family protein, partial [Burkholderiaceae bacterium]|nr:virulence RhuM family protein [Burkholderiaceae bacterium]
MGNEIGNTSQFLFYASDDGGVKVQVIVQDETVWATQKGMAEIFDVEPNTITYHLKNIFVSKELESNSVTRKIRATAADGKSYLTSFYNLDAIISVGYRVNSSKATTFRKWATGILKEYLIKGFAMNDDRLKQGGNLFGKDYFNELLERIREIRASERRFYQKITDLYAQASIDYDKDAPITHTFYASVQNKFHYAIHGHTAAELIQTRANASKPNFGLTSWKNEHTRGKVLKSDVNIAKNYLTEDELKAMNRVVSQYLDFAEGMAERQKAMTMADWVRKLDDFLQFNEYGILSGFGKVSASDARKFA